MLVAVMSDSHDNWPMLELAVNTANSKKCSVLLYAGDLIAPPGIQYLQKFNGKVIFVWGNNENEKMSITRTMDQSENIELAGDYYEGELDGVKVFMNHYPKYVDLAAKSNDFDLVIHGHTHEFRLEKVNNTVLLNPGEIQGMLNGESTFAIFDTVSKEVQKQVLK